MESPNGETPYGATLIPSQKGLFEMSPGVRRWSGAEEATGCRLLASPPYLLRSGQA